MLYFIIEEHKISEKKSKKRIFSIKNIFSIKVALLNDGSLSFLKKKFIKENLNKKKKNKEKL